MPSEIGYCVLCMLLCCKQKRAYEVRIRVWSTYVCFSDLPAIQVVADDAGLDPVRLNLACQRPLGDLGGLVRPDKASFASQPAGYLRPAPHLRARLRARYRAGLAPQALLVGVSWSSRNTATGPPTPPALPALRPLITAPCLPPLSP